MMSLKLVLLLKNTLSFFTASAVQNGYKLFIQSAIDDQNFGLLAYSSCQPV